MRILIAIYGSAHDRAALNLGARLALHSSSRPTLLTIQPPKPRQRLVPAHARDYMLQEGIEVEELERSGDPVEVIVQEAGQGGYDLVIVGDGQPGHALARVRGAPPSLRIVRRSPCPVLIVKGEARPIQRILLCDSGAENPSTGLRPNSALPSCFQRFSRQLAALFANGGEITVLHVMSQMSAGPGVQGKQLRAPAEELIQEHAPEGELLERDLQTLEHARLRTHAEVRHGLVVDEIVDEAQRGNYDLVVIGAHRVQGWQRILLDDLTHRLVLQLDRPVLVV
jgi:nucleotide-binding universal stress UspA family protein